MNGLKNVNVNTKVVNNTEFETTVDFWYNEHKFRYKYLTNKDVIKFQDTSNNNIIFSHLTKLFPKLDDNTKWYIISIITDEVNNSYLDLIRSIVYHQNYSSN